MSVPVLRFKDDDGREFPEWENDSLGSYAENISSGKSNARNESGSYILYGSTDAIGYADDYDYQGEKILIARVGANAGYLYRVDGDYCVSDNTLMLTLKKPNNYSFFFNLLTNTNLNKLVFGSGQPLITGGHLKILDVVIPSLPEQTKIANFLTAVDEKISQLTQKIELLAQYKKGVMQQIFSQELRFKDEDGRDFPEWEVKSLGEIAKFRRGSFPQPYGLEKWYDDINGVPFIQVFDVNDNFRLKNKTKRKISKEAQLQSVFVETGSILITIQGSIGRIAITQYPAYVDRTLLLFESFKVDINKYYFAYVLFLLFEIEKEKAPGGIIKTITKEVLTDFEVFICDYAEQTKIANFLTALDNKITHNQTQLNALKQYKQGLLQQMFV